MDLSSFVIHLIELVAALSGSYYWLKTKDESVKLFVWYLWITVFVETIGMYGYILQNNYDNELFIRIKNSVFCSNKWLYNIYSFVSILLFGKFYSQVINDHLSKKIIKYSIYSYVLFVIFYFGLSGDFFIASLPQDVFIETLLVFIFVMLYYKELLKSDDILFFYKLPIFYLSSGLLLWYLVVTPLFIFDGYLTLVNLDFYDFRDKYLLISIILLYSCYTFGFLYTLQFKKQ